MISFHLAALTEKEAILALINKIYPTYSYNEAFFEWEYLNNPIGKAKIFVAKYNEEIVGTYILTPHQVLDKNKVYTLWRMQNGMINPAYRTKGIFFNLFSYAQQFEHWTNQDMFFGFPNEKSFPYFKKYGFDCQNSYTFWEYESNFFIKKHDKNYIINTENNFDFLTNELFLSFYQNKENYLNIVKDKNYLTWRYINKPDTKYEIYTLKEKEAIIAYIVLKKYINAANEISLHICELQVKDNNKAGVVACLAFCIEKKIIDKAQILNTFLLFPEMQAIIENMGFVKKETNRKIIFLTGLCENIAIKNKIYFSLGDNDIF